MNVSPVRESLFTGALSFQKVFSGPMKIVFRCATAAPVSGCEKQYALCPKSYALRALKKRRNPSGRKNFSELSSCYPPQLDAQGKWFKTNLKNARIYISNLGARKWRKSSGTLRSRRSTEPISKRPLSKLGLIGSISAPCRKKEKPGASDESRAFHKERSVPRSRPDGTPQVFFGYFARTMLPGRTGPPYFRAASDRSG